MLPSMNRPEANDVQRPAEDEVLSEVVAQIRDDASQDPKAYLEESIVPEGGE